MLVIARKAGESIKIAENIEVVVISVEGQRVRLGIKAPRAVRVLRSELEAQVAGANLTAAARSPEGLSALLRTAAEEARKAAAKPPA